MINEHDAKILSDTIKLLQATARDMLYFYEDWHTLFTDRKALLENLESGAEDLRNTVIEMMKNAHSYSQLQDEFAVARALAKNVQYTNKLLYGPVMMTKAAANIQTIIEKALSYQRQLDALLNDGMEEGKSEEDRILDLLTDEELAQVYAWIEGR